MKNVIHWIKRNYIITSIIVLISLILFFTIKETILVKNGEFIISTETFVHGETGAQEVLITITPKSRNIRNIDWLISSESPMFQDLNMQQLDERKGLSRRVVGIKPSSIFLPYKHHHTNITFRIEIRYEDKHTEFMDKIKSVRAFEVMQYLPFFRRYDFGFPSSKRELYNLKFDGDMTINCEYVNTFVR